LPRPVGAGGYHWVARSAAGSRWFVTADDLDGKPWLGDSRDEVFQRLRGALGTARALRDAAGLAFVAAPKVITHGEPHSGNLIRTGKQLMLLDWDTVGLAPPERDLWMLPGDALDQYAGLTGKPVNPAGVRLYQLRWALDDIRAYTEDLRVPHSQTPGAEHSWQALCESVRSVLAA
jgi:spectinomycin phosphotransferase